MASKKDLSERDICTQFILPALQKAGWDIQTQVREEVSFTDGRIYVRGNKTTRGKRKRADFILYYKPNIPIAIIEAKDKYNINMKESWMIGDSESDIKAANAAGISNTILVRSGHRVDESNSNSKFTIDSIKQSKEVIKT